jgi:hypothetical protein
VTQYFLCGVMIVLMLVVIAVGIVNLMNKQDILNKLNALDGKVDLLIAKQGGGEDLADVGNRIDQIEQKVDDALSA